MARLRILVAVLVTLFGSALPVHVVHADEYTYDLATVAIIDGDRAGAVEARPERRRDAREETVSPAPETATTLPVTFVATNTGGYDLYHGTDANSANDIGAKGLNQRSASSLGGGDVFWVTTSLSSNSWPVHFPRSCPPV